VSEAERVAHRLHAEADRHKQLALEASNVDDRMFHRLMFHLCREAASKTLLAEEDFQLGEQLEEAWEDEEEEEEEEEEERAVGDCSRGGWHLP
jgi:hypothetical protein